MPTILIKKSDTPGSVPGTANLTNLAGGAEVAVNTADKRMYSMNSSSAVVELGTNPSSITCADGSFTVARIGSGTVTQLTSTSATITTLTGSSMNVTTATHASANITQLNSTSATISTLTSSSATITNLTATSIVISNLSIASANITTLTSSSATISTTLALSGGTANGVLYLNASKVATSGSALVFDGTNLGVGPAAPTAPLSVGSANEFLVYNAMTAFPSSASDSSVFIARTGSTGSAPFNNAGSLIYRPRVSSDAGRSSHIFYTGSPSEERLRINESGNVGIGTASPGSLYSGANNLVVGGGSGNTGMTVYSGTTGTGRLFFADGTVGADAYRGWLEYSHAANNLTIGTDGATRLTLDSSGNVGIGTVPAYRLDVQTALTGTAAGDNTIGYFASTASGRDANIRFGDSVNASARIGYLSGNLYFYTNGAERMRVTTSGELLVGSTAAQGKFYNLTTYTPTFQVEKSFASGLTAAQYLRGAFITNANDANGSFVAIAKSRGTTDGSTTVVQNGDTIGTITFQGADGSEFVPAADIFAAVDGTPGADDMPGRLVFRTTADNAATPTERMRITSAGDLLFNQAASFIGLNTADGADSSGLTICGGSTASSARGAYLNIYGNENASAGQAELSSGNVSGSYVSIVGRASNSDIRFTTGGTTERMRLTSAGELLVGGTTALNAAQGNLTIERSNSDPTLALFRNDTSISSTESLGKVGFYGNDTTSNTPTLLVYAEAIASGTHAAGDNPTDIRFGTTPDGTETVAEAGRITQAGSYVLKGGTTTAAAGVGIIFPATQVASANANSLDDYEEGTWTPTYYGSSSAGTTTYVTQTGNYTKVGREVTVICQLSISAATGTGEVRIGGLPFSAAIRGYTTAPVSEVNFGGGTYMTVWNRTSEAVAEAIYCGDDLAAANQQITNESQTWYFTLTYFV